MQLYRLATMVPLIPLLSACGSLAPRSSDTLNITSEPPRAEVFVMGEQVGTTPLQVPVARVFPLHFPPEKETLYGRVLLKKEGCRDYQTTVGTRAVARKLHAKLLCKGIAGEPGEKAPGSVRERLEYLEALRRDGAITAEEYAAQRRRILGEL